MTRTIARQDEALEDLIRSTRQAIQKHSNYLAYNKNTNDQNTIFIVVVAMPVINLDYNRHHHHRQLIINIIMHNHHHINSHIRPNPGQKPGSARVYLLNYNAKLTMKQACMIRKRRFTSKSQNSRYQHHKLNSSYRM